MRPLFLDPLNQRWWPEENTNTSASVFEQGHPRPSAV